MNRNSTWLHLFLIVLFAVVPRLFHIDKPLYDRHHFRQTDTLAIVQNFFRSEGDILHPQFFQTPNPENIHGYYFGEFPIYEFILYLLFTATGENLVLARVVSIILMTIMALGVYKIAWRWFDQRVGLVASIAVSLFPSSVFWGRAISPDVMALSVFVCAVALVSHSHKKSVVIISSLLWMVAILLKPFYLAFGLLFTFLLWPDALQSWALDNLKLQWKSLIPKVFIFMFIPVTAYLVWRWWAGQFPAYTIDPDPLSILHNRQGWLVYWHKSSWLSLFWQKHWFGELLTPLGGLLAALGFGLLISREYVSRHLMAAWIIGCAIITTFFAWASQIHDYYLLHWIPVASMLLGIAVVWLIDWLKWQMSLSLPKTQQAWLCLVGGIVVFFTYFLGPVEWVKSIDAFFKPQGYDLYSSTFQKEYRAIENLVPTNTTIVTILKDYSPVPANYLQRRTNIYAIKSIEACPKFSIITSDLEKLRNLGAEYIVFHKTPDGAACDRPVIGEWLTARFPKIYEGAEFDVYQLVQSRLILTGDGTSFTLRAEFMGGSGQFEVGGIPGSVRNTILTPEWTQMEPFVYQTYVGDASSWQSFKIFEEVAALQANSPNWVVGADGFFVKTQ